MAEITIQITRSRIQFEGLPEGCECGNSHTDVAASAWRSAVQDHLERAGFSGCGATAHQPDDHKFDVYVTVTEPEDEEGDQERTMYVRSGWQGKARCIEEGRYDEPVPAEVLAAISAADAADEAGMAAADKAAREDCVSIEGDAA